MAMKPGIQTKDINSITVDREDRQRTTLNDTGIASLAKSIERLGLINPIILSRDGKLIAGERRLTAYRRLAAEGKTGFSRIPFRYLDEPEEAFLLEYEENAQREDLSWQDKALAIQALHNRSLALNQDWRHADTAEIINETVTFTTKALRVADALISNRAEINHASGIDAAYNIISRTFSRIADDILGEFLGDGGLSGLGPVVALPPAPVAVVEPSAPSIVESGVGEGVVFPAPETPRGDTAPPAGTTRPAPPQPPAIPQISGPTAVLSPAAAPPSVITCADFRDWAPAYSGRPFNFLHCDFPYGIDHGRSRQGRAKSWGSYADSEDVYWELCEVLVSNWPKLVAGSAHIMFWHSMTYHEQTKEFFRSKIPGIVIDDFPFIWFRKGNVGILPDPNRGPRRGYEAALFMTVGDRKVIRAVNNCIAYFPLKQSHQSEKPFGMLQHFFTMLVDGSTRMLDPTCGSGTAIRACESKRGQAVGLELDSEFAKEAQRQLVKARLEGYQQDQNLTEEDM